MTDPPTPPISQKKSRFPTFAKPSFTHRSSSNHDSKSPSHDDGGSGSRSSSATSGTKSFKWNKAIAHHFTKDSSSPFYKADGDGEGSLGGEGLGDFFKGGGGAGAHGVKMGVDVEAARRVGHENSSGSGRGSGSSGHPVGQEENNNDHDDEDDTIVVKIPSERMQLWQQRVNAAQPSKGKRLKVGFAQGEPEIIGHGGDETVAPVTEVARRRAARGRSASDRRPVGWEPEKQEAGDFRAPPMRRAQTDLQSASQQQPLTSAPSSQSRVESPVRRPLNRTPTGRSEDARYAPSVPDSKPPRLPEMQTQRPLDSGPPVLPEIRHTSWEHDEPTRRKQVQMRHNEGMTFKRNSLLVHEEGGEKGSFRPLVEEPRLPAAWPTDGRAMGLEYEPMLPDAALSNEREREPRLPDVRPTSGGSVGFSPEPESAISPEGMNPFADPRYMKRHSREASPASQPRPFQRRNQEVPSYMRNAQAAQNLPAQEARPKQEPPPAPSQYKIPVYNHGHKAASPLQSYSPVHDFPPAMPAPPPPMQHMPAPSQGNARSRDPSPLRERPFGEQTSSAENARPLYTRPNGSNTSVNHFPPSPPKQMHSRNASSTSIPGQASSLGHYMSSSRFSSPHQSDRSDSPQRSSINFSKPIPNPHYHYDDHAQTSAGGLNVPFFHATSNHPKPTPSPYSRGPSPADYFTAPLQQTHPAYRAPPVPDHNDDSNRNRPDSSPSNHAPRSPALIHFQQTQNPRPCSSSSSRSNHSLTLHSAPTRPQHSPTPSTETQPAAEAAMQDFALRVVHMRGVLKLTAEKERPAETCTPRDWLRCAVWWFLRGKVGVETLVARQVQGRSGGGSEGRLVQAHVDVAKAWWAIEEVLGGDGGVGVGVGGVGIEAGLVGEGVGVLRKALAGLALDMSRAGILPPRSSLLQGQDNQVWIEYPLLRPEVGVVLRGEAGGAGGLVVGSEGEGDPLACLPVVETMETVCLGRYWVGVGVSVEGMETDRDVSTLPCVLTLLRQRGEFQTSFVVASQTDLINVRVVPHARAATGKNKGKILTWHSVSWKAHAHSLLIRLARGFEITVLLQERDFRALWAVSEHCRRVDHSLREAGNERLAHEARLAELQYADPINSAGFPSDKIKACTARIFELSEEVGDGGGVKRMHRGYRLLLVTDAAHRNLHSVSHQLCQTGPLYFEFLSDSSANGTMAMVLRIRKDSSETRVLLVFPNDHSRQTFYNTLNGLSVADDELIAGKVTLTSLSIEPALQTASDTTYTTALNSLQWQKLGITNFAPPNPHSQAPPTLLSSSLRILARHASGCLTDRLNLSPGELLLRLPPDSRESFLTLFRPPQPDFALSLDVRNTASPMASALAKLLQGAKTVPTVRKFEFASLRDLHIFQEALTGARVVFDGLAAEWRISRRRMVVPGWRNWTASGVRVQVVTGRGGSQASGAAGAAAGITQVLAFFDGFSHAEAMAFQIKGTDDFELVGGDRKGGWGVRLVDAKFGLPVAGSEKGGKGKGDGEQGTEGEEAKLRAVKRRFVNLEGLEYASEHDDVTVMFEGEEERDRFATALPAPATVGKLLNLKRRI
ncbi:hypothetical protein MBLNU230_g6186t1 [Neophaeotheca triangularis]